VTDPSRKIRPARGRTNALTENIKAALPASLLRYIEAKEPEFSIVYGDRTWNEKGYGKHELKDDAGRVVLILEAQPLTP